MSERCHAAADGDCIWPGCPQLRDGEPERSGRHCPYDNRCRYCGQPEAICNDECPEGQ